MDIRKELALVLFQAAAALMDSARTDRIVAAVGAAAGGSKPARKRGRGKSRKASDDGPQPKRRARAKAANASTPKRGRGRPRKVTNGVNGPVLHKPARSFDAEAFAEGDHV